MRLFFLFTICVLLLFSSCLSDVAEKRIYIKSLQIDSASRIDWYITSLIGGFSRGTLLLVTKDKEEVILKSHGITNISVDMKKKLLLVESTDELENFDENDTLNFGDNFKAIFNTKGFYMNDGVSRFSRLKDKNINTKEPHNATSDF